MPVSVAKIAGGLVVIGFIGGIVWAGANVLAQVHHETGAVRQ